MRPVDDVPVLLLVVEGGQVEGVAVQVFAVDPLALQHERSSGFQPGLGLRREPLDQLLAGLVGAGVALVDEVVPDDEVEPAPEEPGVLPPGAQGGFFVVDLGLVLLPDDERVLRPQVRAAFRLERPVVVDEACFGVEGDAPG